VTGSVRSCGVLGGKPTNSTFGGNHCGTTTKGRLQQAERLTGMIAKQEEETGRIADLSVIHYPGLKGTEGVLEVKGHA